MSEFEEELTPPSIVHGESCITIASLTLRDGEVLTVYMRDGDDWHTVELAVTSTGPRISMRKSTL
jgi:hypothetical protein